MVYWCLLGLGLADLGYSSEGLLEAPRLGGERAGPFIERQMFAGEGTLTPMSSPTSPDSPFSEEPWLPRPILCYESGGTRGTRKRTSSLLPSGEAAENKTEGIRLPTPSKGELFHGREAAIQPGPASLFPLSPWDNLVAGDSIHVSWDAGISDISLLTELEKALEPLGMPSNHRVSLGISLDMLGFEEYDGTRLSPVESRHGTPGIRNLSTGLGVTLKF